MIGKFIVVEGIDGCGKTTFVNEIKGFLSYKGIKNILSVRDPGSTKLSEILRSLIKRNADIKCNNYAELFILCAARIQLIEEVIKPSLSNGIWVISDRYDLSSRAYQGEGRRIDNGFVNFLCDQIIKNCYPDITLYLDVSPFVAIHRISKKKKIFDRFDNESVSFFNRIRLKYQELVFSDPKSFLVNANRSFENVRNDIISVLEMWLKRIMV